MVVERVSQNTIDQLLDQLDQTILLDLWNMAHVGLEFLQFLWHLALGRLKVFELLFDSLESLAGFSQFLISFMHFLPELFHHVSMQVTWEYSIAYGWVKFW